VATSEANAAACASSGTSCIDITSAGSGTHTAEFYTATLRSRTAEGRWS
jgi:hypothetical protein